MNDQATSVHVAADAQFGVARILKPFDNFEAVYQGQSLDLAIAFPGGLDPRAGQDGMAPNLMKGLEVPLGARLLVWIPVAVTDIGGQGITSEAYRYTFIWRMRNVRDFRTDRKPYHFPRQSPGAPDSTVVPAEPRFVLPAAVDTILYEGAQPTADQEKSLQTGYPQAYVIGDLASFEPGGEVLLPDGSSGIIQQGVLDPNVIPTFASGGAIFQSLWLDAAGDELIILAEAARSHDAPAAWDFTDAALDLPFSDIYGTGNGTHAIYPDVGIYVFSGSNP